MEKRLSKIESYLAEVNYKKDSFILYCLCVELLTMIKEIKKR